MKQPQRETGSRVKLEGEGCPDGWGAEGLATGFSCVAHGQECLAKGAGEHQTQLSFLPKGFAPFSKGAPPPSVP